MALAYVGVTTPASAVASAHPVICGATINVDTTLHHDLRNCPDNGLVIGSDDMTLDLNGHTIDGDGALVDACPENTACDVGVVNTAGHRGVRVEGGSIRDFAVDVLLIDARSNVLRHLAATNSYFSGIILVNTSHTRVRSNVVAKNGLTTDQAGMDMFGSDENWITNNRVSGNGDIGLFAVQSTNDNRFAHNSFSDNPEAGMILEGNHNRLTGNHLRHNGDGIIVSGDDNHIARNHIRDSMTCADGCGFGVSLEGGSHNIIKHNHVTRAGTSGIRVDAYAGLTTGTVIRGNVVRGAKVHGIAVNVDHVGPVTNTLVIKNFASRARGDGIHVDSASTTLTRNRAFRNMNLGIDALAGVTDGGGNRAARNGNPVQCVNVTCRP